VLYSGSIVADGTIDKGTGFTVTKTDVGRYTVVLDKPVADKSSINVTPLFRNRNVQVAHVSSTEFNANFTDLDNTFSDSSFDLTVTGTETIAVGGGSGGGDYTPEPLVWENKKADRELGTIYTNTNDVPLYLYVELTLGGGESKYVNLYIDGENFGANGTGTTTTSFYNSGLILIPSGSTYELRASSDSGVTMDNWKEAKMPVAVGTGGDSIWTEEDGKAVYDGDIEVNNIGVGRGSGNHLNSTTLGNYSLTEATGDQNTAIGYGTLAVNTTGSQNTGLGSQALLKNTEGKNNTGLGDSSMAMLETGSFNTAVGYQAGFSLTSGSNNIIIGSQAQPSAPDVSNEVTIGNDNITKTRFMVGGTEAMSIEGDPTSGKVKIGTAAGLQIQNVQTTSESYNIPNCYIGAAGDIVKQTNPTVYSIEQVDKKLAVMQKVIDKLEKKLKKAK
jgi:hypothetical protein